MAAVIAHRALHALGEWVDCEVAERDLQLSHQSVGLAGWWWAGETGAAIGVDARVDLAETWADELAR